MNQTTQLQGPHPQCHLCPLINSLKALIRINRQIYEGKWKALPQEQIKLPAYRFN